VYYAGDPCAAFWEIFLFHLLSYTPVILVMSIYNTVRPHPFNLTTGLRVLTHVCG
jgi:hypothetical protein